MKALQIKERLAGNDSAWAISGRNCCYRCSNRSPDRSLGFELFMFTLPGCAMGSA